MRVSDQHAATPGTLVDRAVMAGLLLLNAATVLLAAVLLVRVNRLADAL